VLRIRLHHPRGDVIVRLDAERPHAVAALAYDGPSEAVDAVRAFLERQTGAFGHLIGAETSPVDLHAALCSPRGQLLRPVIEAGDELVASYDPELPDRALS
jgi:hypothetical protein